MLYAIGEIVLVVIGILIALAINNRNEYNKARDNSEVYIQEIAHDLASDTLYLKRMLLNLKVQIAKEQWFLDKTSYTLEDMDSLKMLLPIGTWDFYINDRTYQKIQYAQASKLTGYDDLYKRITDYYNIDKKRIERNTELEIREASKSWEFLDDIHKTLELNFDKTRDISGIMVKGKSPRMPQTAAQIQQFLKLMNSIEARNYVRHSHNRHLLLQLGFTLTQENARELIGEIGS